MRKTPYNPNVTNEQVKQQAEKANKAAEEYHRQRENSTAKNFDELEFDYPNIYTDRIDPENSYVIYIYRYIDIIILILYNSMFISTSFFFKMICIIDHGQSVLPINVKCVSS